MLTLPTLLTFSVGLCLWILGVQPRATAIKMIAPISVGTFCALIFYLPHLRETIIPSSGTTSDPPLVAFAREIGVQFSGYTGSGIVLLGLAAWGFVRDRQYPRYLALLLMVAGLTVIVSDRFHALPFARNFFYVLPFVCLAAIAVPLSSRLTAALCLVLGLFIGHALLQPLDYSDLNRLLYDVDVLTKPGDAIVAGCCVDQVLAYYRPGRMQNRPDVTRVLIMGTDIMSPAAVLDEYKLQGLTCEPWYGWPDHEALACQPPQ